jgi:hypothetical protein
MTNNLDKIKDIEIVKILKKNFRISIFVVDNYKVRFIVISEDHKKSFSNNEEENEIFKKKITKNIKVEDISYFSFYEKFSKDNNVEYTSHRNYSTILSIFRNSFLNTKGVSSVNKKKFSSTLISKSYLNDYLHSTIKVPFKYYYTL